MGTIAYSKYFSWHILYVEGTFGDIPFNPASLSSKAGFFYIQNLLKKRDNFFKRTG